MARAALVRGELLLEPRALSRRQRAGQIGDARRQRRRRERGEQREERRLQNFTFGASCAPGVVASNVGRTDLPRIFAPIIDGNFWTYAL